MINRFSLQPFSLIFICSKVPHTVNHNIITHSHDRMMMLYMIIYDNAIMLSCCTYFSTTRRFFFSCSSKLNFSANFSYWLF